MQVVGKFLLCFMSMSVMEINLFFDQRFASYLAAGSVKLINLANRFMGIPLGVFAVAFSTILLPYFARVKLDNPDRLAFYLFEGTKLYCG
jgi:putative peptidoglycan lipid II flippase